MEGSGRRSVIGLCLEFLSVVAMAIGSYSFLFDNDFETGIFGLLLAIWLRQKTDF